MPSLGGFNIGGIASAISTILSLPLDDPADTPDQKKEKKEKRKEILSKLWLWIIGILTAFLILFAVLEVPELHVAVMGIVAFLVHEWRIGLGLIAALLSILALGKKLPPWKVIISRSAMVVAILMIIAELFHVFSNWSPSMPSMPHIHTPSFEENSSGGWCANHWGIILCGIVFGALLIYSKTRALALIIMAIMVVGTVANNSVKATVNARPAPYALGTWHAWPAFKALFTGGNDQRQQTDHQEAPVITYKVRGDDFIVIAWPEDTYWNCRTVEKPHPELAFICQHQKPSDDQSLGMIGEAENLPEDKTNLWLMLGPDEKDDESTLTVTYSHQDVL
jgi:hypothetical protein